MQMEPTDLLNLPRCGTISGVQNAILHCKIDTVVQMFRWIYKWSLTQGLYKALHPLFLYPIEPEILTPEKPTFCTEPFRTYLKTRAIVRVPITDEAEEEIDLLEIFRKYITLRPKVSSCRRFFFFISQWEILQSAFDN